MVSWGGGAGRGGYGGGGNGVEGSGIESAGGGSQSSLNPSRPRGFREQHVPRRFETPSLKDMRARQGAIVSKFLTFFPKEVLFGNRDV